jgi:hypothetical protein
LLKVGIVAIVDSSSQLIKVKSGGVELWILFVFVVVVDFLPASELETIKFVGFGFLHRSTRTREGQTLFKSLSLTRENNSLTSLFFEQHSKTPIASNARGRSDDPPPC